MITYQTLLIDGLKIFYREAGSLGSPVLLLLHGFPSSSHMFRNLIPALAQQFHLIAPDYPGFGNSSMPTIDEFDYSFDCLAGVMEQFIQVLGLTRYGLYLMGYGTPIGFRLATRHPEHIELLIIQNGNIHEDGLGDFWHPFRMYWQNRTSETEVRLRELLTLETIQWHYTHGVKNLSSISPDNWNIDHYFLNRPGSHDIQLQLFYDYASNLQLYPRWQAYLRQYQPPTLVFWGRNDPIFPAVGAYLYYKQLLNNLEVHLLDTGHFALEEEVDTIAAYILRFWLRALVY